MEILAALTMAIKIIAAVIGLIAIFWVMIAAIIINAVILQSVREAIRDSREEKKQEREEKKRYEQSNTDRTINTRSRSKMFGRK